MGEKGVAFVNVETDAEARRAADEGISLAGSPATVHVVQSHGGGARRREARCGAGGPRAEEAAEGRAHQGRRPRRGAAVPQKAAARRPGGPERLADPARRQLPATRFPFPSWRSCSKCTAAVLVVRRILCFPSRTTARRMPFAVKRAVLDHRETRRQRTAGTSKPS
ncbi:hypothetical protein DIPPA_04308 [Diplonema papillatum]|nr:hypothetical protein DIPPA_04308 [Diplonema papillatum]